jgi:hypothetical protein
MLDYHACEMVASAAVNGRAPDHPNPIPGTDPSFVRKKPVKARVEAVSYRREPTVHRDVVGGAAFRPTVSHTSTS